jgi:hypothetical protein
VAGITIEQLRERAPGQVITPDDESYEDARNGYNALPPVPPHR